MKIFVEHTNWWCPSCKTFVAVTDNSTITWEEIICNKCQHYVITKNYLREEEHDIEAR